MPHRVLYIGSIKTSSQDWTEDRLIHAKDPSYDLLVHTILHHPCHSLINLYNTYSYFKRQWLAARASATSPISDSMNEESAKHALIRTFDILQLIRKTAENTRT